MQTPKWFEISEWLELGWFIVTHVGSENIYFEYRNDLGHVSKGFIKIEV